MKRGRPAQHPRDAKRYRQELGVGEKAKETYDRWYTFLDYNKSVDFLNKALGSLSVER